MLVLTRKQNEKIRIGQDITITVLRMKGKAVRLGIEAPHNISVIRGELSFQFEEGDASADPQQAAPPKSKPRTAGSAVSSEATSHWPLEQSDSRAVSKDAPQCRSLTETWV